MANNITFFGNEGNAGVSATDYLRDNFDDVSIPPNSNSGLTSTNATNPLGYSFLNTDAPKYSVKTLFIKGLNLVQDRSKWINNKDTYEIEWSENFPGINGYVAGNVRLLNQSQGTCVKIKTPDDIIGVTGVVRKIAWLLNGSTATGTADLVTDGADTGSDATFGSIESSSESNGVNNFYLVAHAAGLATKDIHDFRLQANEYNTLSVVGVVVYIDEPNIDCPPGSTYVDKTKQTTLVGSTLSLPAITSLLGANSVIKKTSTNTYTMSTVETPYLNTVGTGSVDTNLVTTTTGHGASFPVGTGIVGVAGTSFYIGTVLSVSTDTLTVSPTLGFALAGNLYKAWYAGPTVSIGATLYKIKHSVDIADQNNFVSALGFFRTNPGPNLFYSEPKGDYRLWGTNLAYSVVEGYPGLSFVGGTTGAFHLEGKYSAAEIEFTGSGILHGTMSINGIPSWGVNEGFTGSIKRTVFAGAGPGYNRFAFTPGSSLSNMSISKVNLYERRPDINATLGVISSFHTHVTPAGRNGHNATMMGLGNWTRVFADSLHKTGVWTRGTTSTSAGGVHYIGTSTNSVLTFGYYGTHFAINGSGGSMSWTLDGASIGAAFGTIRSVPTLGFHNVIATTVGNTPIITAFDYLGPLTGEMTNSQKFYPRPELKTKQTVFNQSDTPRNANDGDIWNQFGPGNVTVWMRLLGRWFQMTFVGSIDDPNSSVLVRTHGSSTAANTGAVADVEHFNLSSWNTGTADTNARAFGNSGECLLGSLHVFVDGFKTDSSIPAYTSVYNRASWSTQANRATPRATSSCTILNSVMYIAKGTADGANGSTVLDAWNGAAWTSALAALAVSRFSTGAFTQGGLARFLGGTDGANASTTHDTYNGSSTGTATTLPAIATLGTSGRSTSGGIAGVIWGIHGDSTASYQWAGSWSSSIATPVSTNAQNETNVALGGCSGFAASGSQTLSNGGTSAGSVPIATTLSFNGAAYATLTSSTNARVAPSGAFI